MSIAVRVSVWILGMLVVVSAAVAVLALMQKQTLQGQNQSLHNQIAYDESRLADLTTKAKKLEDDAGQLNNKIAQAQQEKAQVQSLYDDLKHKSDDLQAQFDQANADRDDWKNRVATISRERGDLMQKFKDRPTQIVYKDRIVRVPAPVVNNSAPALGMGVTSAQGEQYWASVLKQKAALQIGFEKEKSDLDQAALQVVDLKKQNSDLEVEVKQLSNEKDEIIQKIKYGQDLADNLSIDLARSRNDQQAVNGRVDKLKEENLQLLSHIRELNSIKLDLEKTVARLTDDKDAMQKKLIETESVIQSRIDDIWKIKEGLDKKLSENALVSPGSMELPPIIVNAPNNQQQAPPANPAVTVGKTEGSIISINGSNNFVIVDLGQENSSVSVGNPMKVYRNSNEIATLEVIQVRRDICAADIKDKSVELKVGDIVKLNRSLTFYLSFYRNVVEKKISITDVARRANVSITTVSRVLNKVPTVNKEIAQRVEQVIGELKFRPNPTAQRLAKGTQNTAIGFVIPGYPGIFHSFYAVELMRGIGHGCETLRLDLIFHITDGSNPLRSNFAGGLIFADIIENLPQVQTAVREDTPCLVINHIVKDLDVSYIAVDNVKGGFTAAEYLINLGHKRIATITGNMQTQAGIDRFEGFQKALKQHGIDGQPDYVYKGDYSRRSARQAAERFFSLESPPTAIFAASDDMALEIISVAMENGIKVPEDISIIGFDDNPAGLFGPVALTTIKQPLFTMGEEAVKVIYEIMTGKQIGLVHKVLVPDLIVRESCAQPSS